MRDISLFPFNIRKADWLQLACCFFVLKNTRLAN
jgi:hypothetical protein